MIEGKIQKSWEYRDIPNYRVFLSLQIQCFCSSFLNFFFEKNRKRNVQKLQKVEQLNLEARFATPNSSHGNTQLYGKQFQNLKKIQLKFFEALEKKRKKGISRKLQQFEQLKLEVRNTWEYSDSPQLQGWEFQDWRKKIVNFLKTFWKITKKTLFLENYKKK